MKKVIILASERRDGNTAYVASKLSSDLNCDIINLLDYSIGRYKYDHNYAPDDQFIDLMKDVVKNYDIIVFATPVYWYSMSALLKIFFERITDLLKVHKDIGRQLRGKTLTVITSSNGGNLEESFWIPFQHTAEYLGMHYIPGLHTLETAENDKLISQFASTITQHS